MGELMGHRSENLDTVRRELDELAERRLLTPLNPQERRRYEELCEAEYERLGRPPTPFAAA